MMILNPLSGQVVRKRISSKVFSLFISPANIWQCNSEAVKSLIMKVHSNLSDNLSGKMIEGFYLLCWSWFSLVLRDRLLTNTRIPLQRDRLAVYDRRPGESRVHWISFGITVLVEIGSRKDSSVVASNDNKTGVKRRHY